jgi:hypothetical protein
MERTLERQPRIHPHSCRYAHFEAVTVRAAARVLSLVEIGEVSPWDVDGYLRDLLGIDRYAVWAGQDALRKLAERRSCLGHTGVSCENGPRRIRRAASHSID